MKKTLLSKKGENKFVKISKKQLHEVKGGRPMNTGTPNQGGNNGGDKGGEEQW